MRTAGLALLTDRAAGQWGLVTAAQALQEGVSRMQLGRMVDAGLLERLAQGVYASPAVIGDELLPLRVAWLSLAPSLSAEERLADPISSGVVSHASAARLHGLGDLLADVHEFTLPRRYQASREGLRVHRGVLAAGDVTIAAGLPVTTPARTVADLLAAGHDFEHVGQVAVDALRTGVSTGHQLALALGRVRHGREPSDPAELAAELLAVGGLGSRELTTRLVQSYTSLALVRRTLDEQLGQSPQQAKLIEDLAALVSAAAMPSVETRQRIAAWFEDPENQVALGAMLVTIRAYSEVASTLDEDDAEEDDEGADADEDGHDGGGAQR